jgi:hypothetical protein
MKTVKIELYLNAEEIYYLLHETTTAGHPREEYAKIISYIKDTVRRQCESKR